MPSAASTPTNSHSHSQPHSQPHSLTVCGRSFTHSRSLTHSQSHSHSLAVTVNQSFAVTHCHSLTHSLTHRRSQRSFRRSPSFAFVRSFVGRRSSTSSFVVVVRRRSSASFVVVVRRRSSSFVVSDVRPSIRQPGVPESRSNASSRTCLNLLWRRYVHTA